MNSSYILNSCFMIFLLVAISCKKELIKIEEIDCSLDRKLIRVEKSYDQFETLDSWAELMYNDSGHIEQIIVFPFGQEQIVDFKYNYDSLIAFVSNSVCSESSKLYFNANMQLIKYETDRGNGFNFVTVEYYYNSDNKIDSTYVNQIGNPQFSFSKKYHYNTEGDLLEEEFLNQGSVYFEYHPEPGLNFINFSIASGCPVGSGEVFFLPKTRRLVKSFRRFEDIDSDDGLEYLYKLDKCGYIIEKIYDSRGDLESFTDEDAGRLKYYYE